VRIGPLQVSRFQLQPNLVVPMAGG
jgi:hypothetical protein